MEENGQRHHKEEGVDTGSRMTVSGKLPVSPSGEYARALYLRHGRVSSVAPLARQIFNRYKTSVKPLGRLTALPLVQGRSIMRQETPEDLKPGSPERERTAVIKTDPAVQAVDFKKSDRVVEQAKTVLNAAPFNYGEKTASTPSLSLAHGRAEGKTEGTPGRFSLGLRMASGRGLNVTDKPVGRVIENATGRVLRRYSPGNTVGESKLPLTEPKMGSRSEPEWVTTVMPVKHGLSDHPNPSSPIGDIQTQREPSASIQRESTGSAETTGLIRTVRSVSGSERPDVLSAEGAGQGFETLTVKGIQQSDSRQGHAVRTAALHKEVGGSPPFGSSDSSRSPSAEHKGSETMFGGYSGQVCKDNPSMLFRKEHGRTEPAHVTSILVAPSGHSPVKPLANDTGKGHETLNVISQFQGRSPEIGSEERPLVRAKGLEKSPDSRTMERRSPGTPQMIARRETAPVFSGYRRMLNIQGREMEPLNPVVMSRNAGGTIRRKIESGLKSGSIGQDIPAGFQNPAVYPLGTPGIQTSFHSKAHVKQNRGETEYAGQKGAVKGSLVERHSIQCASGQRPSGSLPERSLILDTNISMPLGMNRHAVVEQVVERVESRLSRSAEDTRENATAMSSPSLPPPAPSSAPPVGTGVDQGPMDLRGVADQVYDLIMERLSIERESLGL